MKNVRRMELVIEAANEGQEESHFLHGVELIGSEVFYAVDHVYADMLDDPEMYLLSLMKIRELYQEDELDEAIDLMYMLAALCDYHARIKIEAFACQSEETKEAILNGFVASAEERYEEDDEFEEDEDDEGFENSGYL